MGIPSLRNIKRKDKQRSKLINIKTTPKTEAKKAQLSAEQKQVIATSSRETINYITTHKEQMEDNIDNILQALPITQRIVNLVEKQTDLIPTSSILLTVISKYSHHNSEYRNCVTYRGNSITPNLYTFIILKSGYGKDLTNNKVSEIFEKVEQKKYFYKEEIYKKIGAHIITATAEDTEHTSKEDKEYKGYTPINPDSEYNMAKSTFEGFHSTLLDMNAVNYGNILVKSSEFFDTIINSKSSAEQIEYVKDCYYHGAKVGKTIKSREFKSPTTLSPAICASFHSAMELNENNKDRVIDFAKNGLGRRLLVSMSTQYRFKQKTTDLDIEYNKEIEQLQDDLVKINDNHEHFHSKIVVDYNTAYFSKQQFGFSFEFSHKAQIFLVELNNYFLEKLEKEDDNTFIVVIEQVIKLSLNLHLIEYQSNTINLDIVETAFTLFTLFQASKVKYEDKLFSDDAAEAIDILYNNKIGRTDFFNKHLKKPKWNKKQKDAFLDELDSACHEEDKKLDITKDGNKTMYEIIDFVPHKADRMLLGSTVEADALEKAFGNVQDEAELDM